MAMRQSYLTAILLFLAVTLEPFSASAASLPIEVKIDVVDAMKELASWVAAGFSRWDQHEKQVVKDAVPIVVADLTDIAAIKREIHKWWLQKAPEFPNSLHADDSLTQLHGLLKTAVVKLNKDVQSIDPNWKAKNITTQSTLAQAAISRALTVSRMKEILIGRNGKEKDDDDVVPAADIASFFERQNKEADELVVLAKDMAAAAGTQ
jgi:hypothetical protein